MINNQIYGKSTHFLLQSPRNDDNFNYSESTTSEAIFPSEIKEKQKNPQVVRLATFFESRPHLPFSEAKEAGAPFITFSSLLGLLQSTLQKLSLIPAVLNRR